MAICDLLCYQACIGGEGEGEEYVNFSKTSWGITSDCRQLFTEQNNQSTKG